jgi:hypothetical protein
MRKLLLVLVAAAMLSGCVSMLQDAYDDQRERDCQEEHYGRERIDCR